MVAGDLTPAYRRDRRRLVERLREAGIEDLAVLHAFDNVPRHEFVPEVLRHRSYEDVALPIGHGQTISRPFVHATFLSLLQLTGREKVLEIGTGSGFQTALLGRLAREVYSVERVAPLAELARRRLDRLGLTNVWLLVGDGARGWPRHAPFDAVLIGAACPDVPQALAEQLAVNGTLLIPIGDRKRQQLVQVVRRETGWERTVLEPARFVPLVGDDAD